MNNIEKFRKLLKENKEIKGFNKSLKDRDPISSRLLEEPEHEFHYYTPTVKDLLFFISNEGHCYGRPMDKDADPILIIVDNLADFYFINDYTEGKYSINSDNYLLKYLNRNDIEELGWKAIESYNNPVEMRFVKTIDNERIVLEYNKKNHQTIIYKNTLSGQETLKLFVGLIYNISELRFLSERIYPLLHYKN